MPSHVVPDPAEMSAPANEADDQPAGQSACWLESDRMLYAHEYALRDTFVEHISRVALSVFETHQGSQQTTRRQ